MCMLEFGVREYIRKVFLFHLQEMIFSLYELNLFTKCHHHYYFFSALFFSVFGFKCIPISVYSGTFLVRHVQNVFFCVRPLRFLHSCKKPNSLFM